jgi:hypothetical protein
MSPIVIKSKDLKRAWLKRWKKESLNSPKKKDMPIKPRCLRVDKAINFFRSFSKIVFIPA